jgi:3-hydroxy-3-methylglutaryl CoA synthase
MVGIVSYGGYVPALRIDRQIIAGAWGRGSIGGERSVANNDEDSLTMAVEAAINCINDRSREKTDGLFFASTTAPYQEKMSATMIATVLDLRREIITADYANSLRAGTAALKAAIDSVKSESAQNLLVAAADNRCGYPRSDQEQSFGDGAAAVLVGRENVVATFEGSYSVSNEMVDVWRNPEDQFVRTGEGRFILGEGYTAHIQEVVRGIMTKYELKVTDIAKAIFPAQDGRTHTKLAQSLGFDMETQIQDPLLSKVGHCGVAQPLMMLVAALEAANPGDLLLLAAYADGADAMLFKATERIKESVNRRELQTFLENKLMFPSYARFLSYRSILQAQPGEPFRLIPSATVSWRERNSYLRCHASQCRNCGSVIYPIQRICYNCRSKDEYDEVRISDKEGKVFTFTRDNLAGRSDDPVLVQTVAELDGGVRFYGLMTDCDPNEVEVGLPVDLTFRRFYEGAGFHNYFWKLRPIRREE